MHRSLLLAALTLVLTACGPTGSAPLSPDDGGPFAVIEGWRYRWLAEGPEGRTHLAITFGDSDHGWIATDDGVVYRTTDGARTWVGHHVGVDDDVTDVVFRDSLAGLAVTRNGRIVATADGGRSWSTVRDWTGPGRTLMSIDLVDERHAWAAGNTGLVGSTDGGRTWTEGALTLPAATEQRAEAVDFLDARTGIVVGSESVPTDGGASHRFDAIIFRTGDGGATWDTLRPGGGWLFDVQFLDARTVVAVGATGTILRSFDAGATWMRVPAQRSWELHDVHFVDASNGWAVGGHDDRIIVRTADGGAMWREQPAQGRGELHGIWMLDAMRGWAVGEAGMLLETDNGGVPRAVGNRH